MCGFDFVCDDAVFFDLISFFYCVKGYNKTVIIKPFRVPKPWDVCFYRLLASTTPRYFTPTTEREQSSVRFLVLSLFCLVGLM